MPPVEDTKKKLPVNKTGPKIAVHAGLRVSMKQLTLNIQGERDGESCW